MEKNKIFPLVIIMAFMMIVLNCVGNHTYGQSMSAAGVDTVKIQKVVEPKMPRRFEKQYQQALRSRNQSETEYTRAEFMQSVADQKAATIQYERDQPAAAHTEVHLDGLVPADRVKKSSSDK